MELIDALKTIEAQLTPGMLITFWMADSGYKIFLVGNSTVDTYFNTVEELTAAIEEAKASSSPTLHDELVILNEELAK